MIDRAAHWNEVYTTKQESNVSWFEDHPTLSLDLIAAGASADGSVIDVGGGASHLVDALASAGHDVTVLDLSFVALDVAKTRLGARGENVRWICADVTRWTPDRSYDVWHDRAAFHFMTDPAEQQAYVAALSGALKSGGAAIIASFAPDGPERCSGLPVARHDASDLARMLGCEFNLVNSQRHDHVTPWGVVQKFQFSMFRRR